MNWVIAGFAALSGYLVGSFSFARLAMRLLAPEASLPAIQHLVSGTDETFESDSISATAIRFRMGGRYGCLVAILDMLKAAAPSLAFKLWQPEMPYSLIAATLAVVGHNYPVYYRFRGGRGLATVYGGLFVLDWVGTLVTSMTGMAVGLLLEQVLLIRWAGLVLMIPWTWFRTHDPVKLAYVLAANLLFWYAMLPELRQYFRLRREGKLPDAQEVADFMGMGSMFRQARRLSLITLLKRMGLSSRSG